MALKTIDGAYLTP